MFNYTKSPLQFLDHERDIFKCVYKGDLEELDLAIEKAKNDEPTFQPGEMDPLVHAQFYSVSGITLATKYAIGGGFSENEAYALSEEFFVKVHNATTREEAIGVFNEALHTFTKCVSERKLQNGYSLTICRAIKYIHAHVNEKSSLTLLAKYCDVTPQYLSSLFHKETGYTVSEYYRNEKLKIAASMLVETHYATNKIASLLEFPSQSAFTAQFKAYYGMTPGEYRKTSLS